MRCRFAAVCVLLVSALSPPGFASARGNTAAVAKVELWDGYAALVDDLSAELARAGYRVVELDGAGLCDSGRLTAEAFDLLVLANAGVLPSGSREPITKYLHSGGDIVALNTPLWQTTPILVEGRRTTREQYLIDHAGRLPPNVSFDFAPDGLRDWQRSSNHPERTTRNETVNEGPGAGQRALHVVISDLDGWDTFGSPARAGRFPPGHTLTVFSAKGGSRTTQLAIEWTEADGSRWFAAVPLSREWRQYVLGPADFEYWPSTPGRGGRDDAFHPANAAALSVGLAFTHTGHVGGQHEYWIGPIGTAEMTPLYEQIVGTYAVPRMDTLQPAYKFFEPAGAARLVACDRQAVWPSVPLAAAKLVRSTHPRPDGAGFDKGRTWRWMPLIEARSDDGAWRGTPATLLVHADGPMKGGAWASFGIGDADWYRSREVLGGIGQVARAMKRGVFILDGGANYYTYFDDQEMKLGLRAANIGGSTRAGLAARVTLLDRDTDKQAWQKSWPVTLPPGELASVSDTFKPQQWPAKGYLCTAELLADGEPIDRVEHEVQVWRPRREKQFITIANGDFVLDGRRWRPHGVNYMPSSGMAIEDHDYFENWLGARAYDPQVIQRDLEHIRDIGLNSVSIFIHHRTTPDQNLLDLLGRLEALGLKANLSLRPGTPLDFLWPQMREIIEYYRLRENDTVFAYDLAWEPSWGKHDERKRWDGDWEAWIVERYGSVANAERDWAHAVPRDAKDAVTNPSREQVDGDGDWRRMVAAYRRFLDTLLYRKYGQARRLVRGIDPNHAVSFRMSNTGDPTHKWDGILPYDFPYLAGAVDILEPEAYGRIGDWERVKPGWFEFEYARWAAPHLPMIWAEMGVSTWNRSVMANDPERQAFQADYYRDFYRMMIASGADGVFFWWYPGGYRYNEQSDFGIINPDGTDRPVTRVIREQGPRFINGPDARPVNHWIEFDRDARATGIVGVYGAAKDEFWGAIEAGQAPGLRTAGTGTDSSNCPLLAVGGTPLSRSNPAKYLDAAFDRVEVQDEHGNWIAVEKGQRVAVRSKERVVARLTATNLGEATWLTEKDAPRGRESGVVSVRADGPISLHAPIPSSSPRYASITIPRFKITPNRLTAPTEITFTMLAGGRAVFGEQFKITLVPAE